MDFFGALPLGLHVLLGSLAVVAGTVALASKKGQSTHIRFGRAFVWSMGLSSLLGAIIGVLNYSNFLITAFGGVLSLSLIISSLLTLRSSKPKHSTAEIVIAWVNVANTLAVFMVGYFALTQGGGTLFGFAAQDYFFLGGMCMISLIGDARYFWMKRIAYHRKVARHLWRMCLGMFIAVGSAFTGPGMSAFPESVQNSGLLSLPELLIFLAMIFWLVRTHYYSNTDKA